MSDTQSDPIAVSTNGGEAPLDMVGDAPDNIFPGLGEVHFHESGIANILGLYHLTQKYRVVVDSAQENAFWCALQKG